jgi:hypothetical protein
MPHEWARLVSEEGHILMFGHELRGKARRCCC